MRKFHVKSGDEVVVIAGRGAGSRGKVLRISGKHNRAVVEGLHMMKRHTKKSQKVPEGGIIEREGSVHLSNLMAAEKFDARVAARGGSSDKPAESSKS